MNTFSLYQNLSQRHPGSVVFTSSYLTPLPLDRHSTVADLGCGYGGRATWVARSRCCAMHLFDTSTDHLDSAFARAEEGGSESLMTLHHVASGDYGQLDAPPASYDLLMTEGLGFEVDALSYVESWSKLVKPGGAIAVTVPGLTNQQVSPEVVAPLNEARGVPLATLDHYHEQIASIDSVKLVHQVTLAQHSWDEHYQNLGRCLNSLIKTGEVSSAHEGVQRAQAELDWYRSLARGHIFLQAFVLAVEP